MVVSVNGKYLSTGPGVGKLFTIVLGVFAISLGGNSNDNSAYNVLIKLADILNMPQPDLPGTGGETFFLAMVGLLLVYSIFSVLAHVFNEELTYTRQYKLIDIGVHGVGALLQILAGSLMIASAGGITQESCQTLQHNLGGIGGGVKNIDCQLKTEKDFAGVFAILNCVLYGFLTWVNYARLNYNDVVVA